MSQLSFNKLPGVLSFQRLTITSDALFYNALPNGGRSPISVVRHGIRGTQNVNKEKEKDKQSNVQITETAKTASDATGFVVEFSLAFLPLEKAIFSCAGENGEAVRQGITGFVQRARGGNGVQEIAQRYARNLLNGRWLWRNRLIGQSITVNVFVDGEASASISANALEIDTDGFNNYTTAEVELGRIIADGLNGIRSSRLRVEAHVQMGFSGAVEVFPSQNFANDKPRGFARPLYKVDIQTPSNNQDANTYEDTRIMGHAALRDQKIGNAIRTIDTWYKDYSTHGKPIAVEPLGASLDMQKFYREKGDTSFKIMLSINTLDPDSDDGKFLLACLVRGGVYSESDKN
jgi:CRISPR-associated protein Csy3